MKRWHAFMNEKELTVHHQHDSCPENDASRYYDNLNTLTTTHTSGTFQLDFLRYSYQ